MTPLAELAALGAFYRASIDGVITRHGAALATYAEWVLGRDAFALVTLGDVATLAQVGTGAAVGRFRSAAARWPAAVTGVKLDPAGREAPTLYVRSVCPWQEGVSWIQQEIGIDATSIPAARTFYGLGFQAEVIKTYALSPGGFVSFRLDGTGLRSEHKEYRADVAWAAIAWPDARWAAIGALGCSLGFGVAGHVGRSAGTGEMKVYVERLGAIPTDRSLS